MKKHKILCISDTHTKHNRILNNFPDYFKKENNIDTIIHAGDISNVGYLHEVENFLRWFSSLNMFKNKIFIAGNHDFLFQNNRVLSKDILKEYPNINYLEDSGIEIDGIKFWGSPQTPAFNNWAFNRERGNDIKRFWDEIPMDTDILITHGPAKGIGDYIRNKHLGCEELLLAIQKINPLAHIYGHIHNGYGKHKIFDTISVNASLLNESYHLVNKPLLIEV